MILSICLLTFTAIVIYWLLRPNRASINDELEIESWDIEGDGRYDAFTDMVYLKDHFHLAYRSAASHFALKSKIIVMKSTDARKWEIVAKLKFGNKDVRDPKLVIVHDRLYLYVLINKSRLIKNYATVFSSTIDGVNWDSWQVIEPKGWLFWRPITRDNITWYVVAAWHESKESALFQSKNGVIWEMISTINDQIYHSEFAIQFSSESSLIGLSRIDGKKKIDKLKGLTLIGTSESPFLHWPLIISKLTRLDGPVIFSYKNQMYAVGRFEPKGWLSKGILICRKRTSLFLVNEDRLSYISDLPSAGDTAYAGAIIRDDHLYVSYYSSNIKRDYPWILGLITPTKIRMARINLNIDFEEIIKKSRLNNYET